MPQDSNQEMTDVTPRESAAAALKGRPHRACFNGAAEPFGDITVSGCSSLGPPLVTQPRNQALQRSRESAYRG